MYPEIATIGPLTLYSFGAMMGIGFLAGARLAGAEFARRGMPAEIATNVMLAAAVGGILGSRVLAIFDEWANFVADPLAAVFNASGFVWYGGLIGGAIGATVVFRRNGVAWLRGADCVAPGLALGQALGRIGCHLAGDGDWGKVTEVAWGVAYTRAIIGWPYEPGVLVHPTPLYEAAAYLLCCALMLRARHRLHGDGQLFALYLLTVPAARFAIEFYRINPPVLMNFSQAQVISLVLFAGGCALYTAAAKSAPLAVPAVPAEPV